MLPDAFKYEPQTSTKKQFGIVKSVYTRKDIDCIYYAGDSGREGIYIQALIRNQIFKKAPNFDEKVVWIDSFTEEAILEGIRTAKPYSAYQNMIDSGYGRAISDWLIGMNFTEGFTLTSGKLMNTGRVMTPTLAMVVQRQYEIDNFTKTYYYGVKADSFATWKAVKGSAFFESDRLYSDTGFEKKAEAEKLIADCNTDKRLTVESVKVQTKTEYAPYLFNLADLQAYCSKAFHISPAQTLSFAQSLYEKKATTYPRTDCRFLSTAVQADYAKKGYNVPDRYVDDSKITDHYAIVPTLHGNAESLSGTEKQVYEAILKRFTDTMKPPYIYDSVSVTYIHKNGERFFESFKIVKQTGFKGKLSDDESKDISSKAVPEKGSVVNVGSFNLCEMETKPPVAYTTGSLILAMEKAGKLVEDEELREQIKTCGIGTSATRAAIIEKLIEKEFISVDKKQKITPTEFGKAVIPVIAKYDEALISPVKTADMEAHLNDVAEGKATLDDYVKSVKEYVSDVTKNILSGNSVSLAGYRNSGSGEAIGKCPKCGAEIKKGKFGFYCTAKCGMNIAKVFGKELSETQIKNLCSGKKVTYTANGKKTTVLPEWAANEWQGKTYYNWKTESSFASSVSGKSSNSKKSTKKSSSSGSNWNSWKK
jgi:DNA topoisomerase-3